MPLTDFPSGRWLIIRLPMQGTWVPEVGRFHMLWGNKALTSKLLSLPQAHGSAAKKAATV